MLNDIKLHGYLGRDPELSWINGRNGQFAKTVFILGVGRDFGDETDWFFCEITGNRAEVIDKWFQKGSEIIVYGRMESYKPKNNPNRIAWLVKMSGFDFCKGSQLGNTGSNYSAPAPAPTQTAQAQSGPVQQTFEDLPDSWQAQEDDIPF